MKNLKRAHSDDAQEENNSYTNGLRNRAIFGWSSRAYGQAVYAP